jgi:hypothetical protein
MTESGFRRFASVTAMLSVPAAIASIVVGLAAANFDFAVIDDPGIALTKGAAVAPLAHWAMILDLFGYYVLLLPCALVLWRDVRPQSPAWIDFATLNGVAYVLIGSMGAGMLAVVWPPLIRAYASADAGSAPMVRLVFETFTTAVDRGLWNTLELTFAGCWWFVLGRLLPGRGAFRVVSLLVGLASWLDVAGTILEIPSLASTGLSVYLVLAPVWAALCSLSIRRAVI